MKKVKHRNIVFPNALITGFSGGLLLALVYSLFHYFSVSKVGHKHILAFFQISGSWIEKWYGYIVFVLLIALLSTICALIYYVLLKRVKGWFAGAMFGIGLWIIFGLLIPLFVYDVTFITFYKSYTNVLNFCSLLLYGIFIGYSISYDEEMSQLTMDRR